MNSKSRHAIIVIKNNENKYLQYYDERWDSYLFLNCKLHDNSDEIVKTEIVDDGLDICVESDLTGDYHHIIINAQNITVIRNERT